MNPIVTIKMKNGEIMKAELYRLHPELEHTPDIDKTLDALIRGV